MSIVLARVERALVDIIFAVLARKADWTATNVLCEVEAEAAGSVLAWTGVTGVNDSLAEFTCEAWIACTVE